MDWRGWTALGVLGAAIAVPILKKRRMHRADSYSSGSFGSQGDDSLGTMGGRTAPSSDTWAQGGGTP